ncbi:MAG: energy transducer TonB [Thalassotalea sp.]
MSANKDDELLSQLYQQRKSTIVVPKITLEDNLSAAVNTAPPIKNQSPAAIWARVLIALIGGSFASFGVLALITYLAQSPEVAVAPIVKVKSTTDLELKQDDTSELATQAVASALAKIARQLPKKGQVPAREQLVIQSINIELPKTSHQQLAQQFIMQIKQPQLDVKLVHQVLPKFPDAAIIAGLSGYVKLAYQIKDNGEVVDIKVVDSSAHRDIEKAAISALAQWQYLMQGNGAQAAEIIFEFKKS